MSTLTSPSRTQGGAAPARSRSVRVLRAVGWTLIAAGLVILLYVAYALWFTGLETGRAQQELRQQWEQGAVAADVGEEDSHAADAEGGGGARPGAGDPEPAGPPLADRAVAKLEFARPGSDESPVSDEPLFVVDGVGHDDLADGPGHYPETAAPGEEGNFAVAGHRTTYGSPFFSLDDLRDGDEIRVTDRSGQEHVYEFAEQQVVAPNEAWVLGGDPLATDRPTVTLTTCHPRFSAAQRMVVFGELAS